MPEKKKVYVVANGRRPGVYAAWDGSGGAQHQVLGHPGAVFKGFADPAAAAAWLRSQPLPAPLLRQLLAELDKFPGPAEPRLPPAAALSSFYSSSSSSSSPPVPPVPDAAASPEHPEASGTADIPSTPAPPGGEVLAYSDGSASPNPGRGGFGVVLRWPDGRRQEFAAGFHLSTNNRMELMGCIAALKALPPGTRVVLTSDSSYVVNGIAEGWARKWRARGWMRPGGQPAENADLWDELLRLCETRGVRFRWIRGHAGHPENERCDQLAAAAANAPGLLHDFLFENR